MKNSIRYKLLLLSAITAIVVLVSNCTSESKTSTPTKNESIEVKAEYIGDASCKSCHNEQHKDWIGSHHDWAMKTPNDTSVFGNRFNYNKF